MKMNEIMEVLKKLSEAQGLYGAIYRFLEAMPEEDPYMYERTVKTLEGQNFKNAVDVAMYFEA